MNVSSQEHTLSRRWARQVYLGLASLIVVGIVIEGVLIGPSLFVANALGAGGPW